MRLKVIRHHSTDDYTHRIGRTGRINRNGDALTFVTRQDSAMIADLEKLLRKRLKRRTLQVHQG